MRTAYALLAIAAEYVPGGRLHIFGGDIDTIRLPSVPSVFGSNLVLVAKLMLTDDECDQDHNVKVEMSRMGDDVVKIVYEVEIASLDPSGEPWSETGAAILATLGPLQFDAPGMHYFRLLADGKEAAKLPLLITAEPVEPE